MLSHQATKSVKVLRTDAVVVSQSTNCLSVCLSANQSAEITYRKWPVVYEVRNKTQPVAKQTEREIKDTQSQYVWWNNNVLRFHLKEAVLDNCCSDSSIDTGKNKW